MTTNNKPAHTPKWVKGTRIAGYTKIQDAALPEDDAHVAWVDFENDSHLKLAIGAPLMAKALKELTDKSPYAEERGTEFCIFCMMRDWQNHADDCPFILGKAALAAACLNDENEGV